MFALAQLYCVRFMTATLIDVTFLAMISHPMYV